MTVAVSLRLEFSASSADLALSTSAFSSASLLLSATARSASFLASASAFSASRTLASDSSLSLAIAASLSATARSLARISASLAASTPATCVRTAVGAVSRELGGGTHLCFGLDFRGLLHGLVHLDEGFRDGCGRLRPGGLAELAAVSTGHLRSRLRPLCGVRFGGNAGGGGHGGGGGASVCGAACRGSFASRGGRCGRGCSQMGASSRAEVSAHNPLAWLGGRPNQTSSTEMELQQRRPRGEKIEKEEARCGSRMSSLRIPRGAD
ncbi:hypothetical protein DFJ74DRAFT_660059 [Hyaloraphidium curvatum]|nr:hypothetical protein DFJ74DRAFT_660059 [Hyaloraphidium curvatum]